MYPAGFFEEETAEELAIQYGISRHICRLVVLIEEENEIPLRRERIFFAKPLFIRVR